MTGQLIEPSGCPPTKSQAHHHLGGRPTTTPPIFVAQLLGMSMHIPQVGLVRRMEKSSLWVKLELASAHHGVQRAQLGALTKRMKRVKRVKRVKKGPVVTDEIGEAQGWRKRDRRRRIWKPQAPVWVNPPMEIVLEANTDTPILLGLWYLPSLNNLTLRIPSSKHEAFLVRFWARVLRDWAGRAAVFAKNYFLRRFHDHQAQRHSIWKT